MLSSQRQERICGPWIPDDGKIVTHTVSKAGKMTQKYWTSKVSQPKHPFFKSTAHFQHVSRLRQHMLVRPFSTERVHTSRYLIQH